MSLYDILMSLSTTHSRLYLLCHMRKIVFIIPPAVELLDLAGPMQVFSEASFYGFELQLEFYSIQPETASSVGLPFGKLQAYSKAALQAGDFIFIPGVRFESLKVLISWEKAFFHWLRDTAQCCLFSGRSGITKQPGLHHPLAKSGCASETISKSKGSKRCTICKK